MKKLQLNLLAASVLSMALLAAFLIPLTACGPSGAKKTDSVPLIPPTEDSTNQIHPSNVPHDSVPDTTAVIRPPRPTVDTAHKPRPDVAYKPNIYIYPAQKIPLGLHINFPLGGSILTSIPEYGEGWLVSVDTNGRINENYDYLFYESTQPDVWQTEQGWLVPRSDLRHFFTGNMANFGFSFRETKDFVEYWIPRLNEFEYYQIYPQDAGIINKAITLDWSTPPDHMLRLFYVIRGVHDAEGARPDEPGVVPVFVREGFFAAEWGVIIK